MNTILEKPDFKTVRLSTKKLFKNNKIWKISGNDGSHS